MKTTRLITLFLLIISIKAYSQLPLVFSKEISDHARKELLVRRYLSPHRVVWQSDLSGKFIENTESLFKTNTGQADLNAGKYLLLKSTDEYRPGLVLDFGKEIHGGIEIVTAVNSKVGHIHIRLGESVSEAMSNIGTKNAGNDHAIRDFTVTIPWAGKLDIGNSGFRFARIDLVDPNSKIEIKEINAIFTYQDIPYLGSFKCNDDRLNNIWLTGAYTVHLNMQDYLWDGIKRDRMVWVGDLHPEVMTINSVFGYNEVVPKSLDLVRNLAPLPNWINGIGSYSMWWILIHYDWFRYHGNLNYLQQQKEYLLPLLDLLISQIDTTGKENLQGWRFLDWPTSENSQAIHAGLQAMMVLTFKAGAELCKALKEPQMIIKCDNAVEKLKKHIPDANKSKQAAALLALSDLVPADKINSEILAKDGSHGISTFFGYYILQARAKAGDYLGALENIREYWGAMLDLGATTFWEDFDIDWIKNTARIDSLVPEGKKDVHGDYGKYCYTGFRHSLCHGWASGPTSWLTQHVLGVNVLEPGCRIIKLEPHLGDLQWVEGSFPTPLGILEIKHLRKQGGKVQTTFRAPKGIKVLIN